MITSNIYFNYYEEHKKPAWLIVDVKNSDINWDKKILLIPIPIQPFEMLSPDDIDYDSMNISIYMNELLLNVSPNHFGINLDFVKERLIEHDVLTADISNFIIQICDIEELLLMTI